MQPVILSLLLLLLLLAGKGMECKRLDEMPRLDDTFREEAYLSAGEGLALSCHGEASRR